MIRVRNRHHKRLVVESLEKRDVPAAGRLVVDTSHLASDRVLVKVDATHQLKNPVIINSEDLGHGLYSVELRRGISVQRGLKILGGQRGVEFAEPDYVVHADVIPNDPSFGSLWGLDNTGQSGGTPDADIDAPEAWDVSTGSGNMLVAIIDTGVNYNHPDLSANMWHNPVEPIDGVDNDGNGLIDDHYGADFANGDADPMDDHGHGTHVAGTIGAVGNNGIGVTGVNWDVQIMAVKFLGANGSGSITNAVKSLTYAYEHGAQISNNSWGGGGFSSAMNAPSRPPAASAICLLPRPGTPPLTTIRRPTIRRTTRRTTWSPWRRRRGPTGSPASPIMASRRSISPRRGRASSARTAATVTRR